MLANIRRDIRNRMFIVVVNDTGDQASVANIRKAPMGYLVAPGESDS
jgi:hypothetical protein